ncbi:hypothetical protein SDJN02_21426 [Cucurbita argyrosperma subsp. argyrosperma]|nr:hypothetical protein SDJN02_21426 [Cucurbita argyrosperma subsp. argyrosperma]
MALSSCSPTSISLHSRSPRTSFSITRRPFVILASSADDSPRPSLRISANSNPKARFVARRSESVTVRQLSRPLNEYMSLPASQYSVLDAERIERIDDCTFRCYVYRFKFFAFEVCPVLIVRVEVQPNGCCIKLLSTALTLIWCRNAANMVNQISYDVNRGSSPLQKLTSDTVIEVNIEIPFAFRAIPVQAIESAGTQVLEQILKLMLPRFTAQLVKDYQAWASGDTSRQPLGTGEI